jgi:hypothetical protein
LGRKCGENFGYIVTPLVCHDDAPIPVPSVPLQGGGYFFGLASSGTIIVQDLASLVCDPFLV